MRPGEVAPGGIARWAGLLQARPAATPQTILLFSAKMVLERARLTNHPIIRFDVPLAGQYRLKELVGAFAPWRREDEEGKV
jgi:hypothetical protein